MVDEPPGGQEFQASQAGPSKAKVTMPLEPFLVDLADTLQAFRVPPLASGVVTKVDGSRNFAGIFNQLCTPRQSISYLTTGPRVPGELELATRRRLVGFLFNPENGPVLRQ